jgi:hypothetical protein
MTDSPFLEPVTPKKGERVIFLSGCDFCIKNRNAISPPHDASHRCESGGYTHCSCDRCF